MSPAHFPDDNEYSDKYTDDTYEYRHVILSKPAYRMLQRSVRGYSASTLLDENQWRSVGVTQSRGWVHYATHKPEPNILLFRRPLGTNPLTGKVEVAPPSLRQTC
ncbi:Cyclin-dependent kinases regulatory subunit 2 [Perkinsus olseni]|uniref:Cyclin-dependent kinases regulatory subunit n=1 Tax=Perkinsus olseni TaxID=32597 RepID=A0A7J6TRT3_PEROL|nr:Cyclin-dependent kinases regulatory subunit 2 [Perkinsus olseni]